MRRDDPGSNAAADQMDAEWRAFDSPAWIKARARDLVRGLTGDAPEFDAVTLGASLFTCAEVLMDGSDQDRALVHRALIAAQGDFTTARRSGDLDSFAVWKLQILVARVRYRIGDHRIALRMAIDLERKFVTEAGGEDALLASLRSGTPSELNRVVIALAGILPAILRDVDNPVLRRQLWSFGAKMVVAHLEAVERDAEGARTDRTIAVASQTIKLLALEREPDGELIARLKVVNDRERHGVRRYEATSSTTDAAVARSRGDLRGEKENLADAVKILAHTPLIRQRHLAEKGRW